jgi:hypothetical protein
VQEDADVGELPGERVMIDQRRPFLPRERRWRIVGDTR